MRQSTVDRFIPASPESTYAALRRVVPGRFSVKSTDDFTKAVVFSSGASLFTWGENFSAQVVPAEGGSVVRVQGSGKVGGQLAQNSRLHKLITTLFDDLSAAVQAR